MVNSDGDQPMSNYRPKQGQNVSVVADSLTALMRRGSVAFWSTVRRVSFWSAILLPLVYLPLLSGGMGAQTGYIIIGLLGLNLLALLVGHNHTQTHQ